MTLNSARPRVYFLVAQRLEFGSRSEELNSVRTRVNVNEACSTLALRARRNIQLLAQALSVIRNLPKILNFVKIIHYYSKLFTGVLNREICAAGHVARPENPKPARTGHEPRGLAEAGGE